MAILKKGGAITALVTVLTFLTFVILDPGEAAPAPTSNDVAMIASIWVLIVAAAYWVVGRIRKSKPEGQA